MRKKMTGIIAKFLAFVMVLQMAVPTTAAYAAEPIDSTLLAEGTETFELEFDSEASYVLATNDGKAAVVSTDWGVGTKFTGTYKDASNKVSSDATMFKITSDGVEQDGLSEGEIKVKITCSVEVEGEMQDKDFASEAIGSAAASPFASSGNNEYIITKTAENKGIIESVSNTRTALGLVQEDGKVLKQTTDNQAIPFEDGVEIIFVKDPEAVDSFGSDLGFSAENTYVIATGDKALMPVKGGADFDWTGRVKATAAYVSESNQIYDEEAQFTIVPTEEQTGTDEGEQRVTIGFVNALDANGTVCNLRTEGGQTYAWADGRTDSCTYIIKLGGDGKYTIKEDSPRGNDKVRYLSVNATSEELEVLNTSLTEETATRFTIVSDYEITEKPAGPSEFTITHVGSAKLVKTYATAGTSLTVDGAEGDKGTIFTAAFGTNANVAGVTIPTVGFVSRDYNNGIASVYWDDNIKAAVATDVRVYNSNDPITGSGWESVVVVPNGDGTVALKDSYYNKYITVDEVNGAPILVCGRDLTEVTNNEKFVISSGVTPGDVANLEIVNNTRTQTSLELKWTNPTCIYTDIQIWQKKDGDLDYTKIATLGDASSYVAEGLQLGTPYHYKVVVVNGRGDAEDLLSEGKEVTGITRAGEKPATPVNVTMEEKVDAENTFVISWDAAENATHYRVLRAESMFGTYEEVAVVTETNAEVTYAGNKYTNYYCVVALNNGGAENNIVTNAEESEASSYTSLETNLFGDHTLIFAPTDDTAKIDETLQALFDKAHDAGADAQFRGEHWQIYFKPGDYTETSCINLGFYTSINGLGKTPYDVKLNNVAIPAYLADYNATCNFWRSMENVSIIKTGNAQGNAGYDSWRGDWFNWGVAQAAPLRRVYSERPVAYDWNYGWASGGYVADCYFAGVDGEGNSAGTWSGQQFYTRNSKLDGNAFGTTLNNFFQGVTAPNLPDAEDVAAGTATELLSGEGYTNWKIADASGNQQVFTNVENTKEIAEKPFLYIDDNGEYQVFVPAIRENAVGTSWSKDNMGEGKSIPLDDFYVAYPTDSAATINEQLSAGKHIYFTPGIYYAEETIKVTNPDTILLGTGLATIIPDDGVKVTVEYAAMEVADVDGVRIAGLIFDAGEHSRYLLVVGEKTADEDHSDNPTVLQDLFFRVGGTTDVLTKSDDALEINSDDVIGDHFWIWRADHGAGVAWYGNESKHGLIVNGDDVTCYALFNEHFQEYHTLWNGENGATYFYQNETAYDPISQEAWMSPSRIPGGEPQNGYASYKVAEGVENHYAVGLGVYNVFIYTGPTYDSSEVQIQLDNAIEVPDAKNVLVENACLQTFADANKVLQKINSVVNGMGDPVSSGLDPVTGEKGTDWNRSFLRYYRNGEAEGSYRDLTSAYNNLKATYDEILKQLDVVTDPDKRAELEAELARVRELMEQYNIAVNWPITDETQDQLDDMEGAADDLRDAADSATGNNKATLNTLINSYRGMQQGNYPQDVWNAFQSALTAAIAVANNLNATQEEIQAAEVNLTNAYKGLVNVTKNAKEELKALIASYSDLAENKFTEESWQVYQEALKAAQEVMENENASVNDVNIAKAALVKAYEGLKRDGLWMVKVEPQTYTGKAIKPEVEVYDGETLLVAKKDYTVSYSNNVKVGKEAKIKVKGKGNYTGTIEETFVIEPKDLSSEDITVADVYANIKNNDVKNPKVVVKDGKKTLAKGTTTKPKDYTFEWPVLEKDADGKIIPKTYTITVTGQGNYTGTTSFEYDVRTETILLSKVKVKLVDEKGADIKSVDYAGVDTYKPNVIVTYGSGAKAETLVEGEHYTFDHVDYDVVGKNKASVVLTAVKDSKYYGSKTQKYTVVGRTLSGGTITVSGVNANYAYTGQEIRILDSNVDYIEIIDKKNKLESGENYRLQEGKDFEVEYQKNVDAGNKATMIIKGKGLYAGTLKKTFKITALDLNDYTTNSRFVWTYQTSADYNKSGAVPDYTLAYDKNADDVIDNDEILVAKKDYTVTYKNNKKAGNTATMTIKGKGNFRGTLPKVEYVVKANAAQMAEDIITFTADDLYINKSTKSDKLKTKLTLVENETGKKLSTSDYNSKAEYFVYDEAGNPRILTKDDLQAENTIYVKVTLKGNYAGSLITSFRLYTTKVSTLKIVSIPVQDYVVGKAATPPVTVKMKVKEGNKSVWVDLPQIDSETGKKNYEISYSNNGKIGTAKVTVTGVGNGYGGTKTVTFKIKAQKMDWADWYNNVAAWFGGLFE